LMVGPPGLGKSRYTEDLGRVLSSPIFRLSYDSAHTSSTLLGSDKNWGNSTAGLVFEAVCASPLAVANPILMLDEIDKSRKDGGYQDPLASLHSLTEPVTSKSVTDISLGFTFSAGHVIWIAAANYQHLIPETILSRFHVFEIQPPTGWGAVRLAQSVCRDSYAKLGTDFMEPGRELIRLIYHLSAREQRKVWEQAYANAVSDGRLHLEPCDFPHDDDERKSSINKKQWTH
jgi:ATP-dependent Lon protease